MKEKKHPCESFPHFIHGADYNPEQWMEQKDTIWKQDMEYAKGAGINTLSIGIFGFNIRNPRSSGTISRPCGIIWLAAFLVYLILLVRQEAFMA